MRILAGIIMISVGAFALYTVISKPKHSYSGEPLDQALGIPKIVNRIIRGGVGLFFIALGIITILRALQLMP
jgi:hypothetical protein